jgi:hypothetical protein
LLGTLGDFAGDVGQKGDLPVRREHDLEPAILGHLRQPVRVFLEPLLIFAAEPVLLFPEILLAKRLGQRFFQPCDEAIHVPFELPALARFQADGPRLVRILEVVHVRPVVRRRRSREPPLQRVLDRLGLAGPGQPGGVDIIPRLRHAQAHFESGDGSILADDLVERLQFRRGLELERIPVNGGTGISSGQFLGR